MRTKSTKGNTLPASTDVAYYNEVQERDEGKTDHEEGYEDPDKMFKPGRARENPSSYDHNIDQPVYTTITDY